jgi:hypothetical protein
MFPTAAFCRRATTSNIVATSSTYGRCSPRQLFYKRNDTPTTTTAAVVRATASSNFSTDTVPFYSPLLTEKRSGEAGRGGRSSEAACKVAVFGGSGFLGTFVCGELGNDNFPANLYISSFYTYILLDIV